ncbi:hypothetical protein N7476_003548 [Penicillium atrosanguineum]|uniref:Uncharacterized protein n=1 Tax=Penicillium atrosanguineum TaxID=1132637 RepID=A0A9W9U9P3_9EURO|nr:hypothetical protein N7476_003548 [Penicillium atrosanguineum]
MRGKPSALVPASADSGAGYYVTHFPEPRSVGPSGEVNDINTNQLADLQGSSSQDHKQPTEERTVTMPVPSGHNSPIFNYTSRGFSSWLPSMYSRNALATTNDHRRQSPSQSSDAGTFPSAGVRAQDKPKCGSPATHEYVKEVVGPDGPLFADFETSMVLLAYEKLVRIRTQLALERSQISLDKGDAAVAMYFLSTADNERNGENLETKISPLLTAALEKHCQNEVWGVIANIGIVLEKLNLNAYFEGANIPQYALVVNGPLRVPENIGLNEYFVVFSHETLIMNTGKDIRFPLDLQPTFYDLPGPSHLDGLEINQLSAPKIFPLYKRVEF